MRFGRHLKEQQIHGYEKDVIHYDTLKKAIKTQLLARWGISDDHAERNDRGRDDDVDSVEEALLESAHAEDGGESHRAAFFDAFGSEIRRVSERYDATCARLREKVAALLAEASRPPVLENMSVLAPDTPTGLGTAHSRSQHDDRVDRAFRHVYHEITIARHVVSLNYTGLRKIAKKYLKKSAKAAYLLAHAVGTDEHVVDETLRDETRELLSVISEAREAMDHLKGVGGGGGIGRDDDTAGTAGGSASTQLARRPRSEGGNVDSDDDDAGTHRRRSDVESGSRRRRADSESVATYSHHSHHSGSLLGSPSRTVYRASAALAEADVRERLRELPCNRGDEPAKLETELERAYTKLLGLDEDEASTGGGGGGGGGGADVARRRLRLIERPAPPAAGQLSSFAFGAGTIAAFALLVMWIQPVTTRGHDCPRCLQYFQASLPAFRLAAIPIVWLWCWAGVTRACGAHYINYRFLLEVSLEEEAGWHWNAAIAAVLTAGWLVIFALFTACVRFGIDPLVPGSDLSPAYYPLGLLVFVILILTFPPSTIFAVGRTAANKSPDSSDSSDSSDSFAAKMRRVMRIFNPRARASLLRSIAHMAIAPFGPPIRFRDNLVADVACSMVRCLVDGVTTARFFFTGEYEKRKPSLAEDLGPTSPVITAIPYWIRLQQCVRRFYDSQQGSRERIEHVINAGKYTMSLVSIGLASVGRYSAIDGPFWSDPGRVAWISCLFIGALYSFAWDVVMDWGLVEVSKTDSTADSTENLRFPVFPLKIRWKTTRDRVFRSTWFYAWAVCSNLVGRFAWAVTITPHMNRGVFFIFSGLTNEGLATLVAVVELLRRAQWTFLRLENEYLNNAAHYRSVVAAPMLLDDAWSERWDAEWRFEREEAEASRTTAAVYAVMGANAGMALAVIGVFYLVYSGDF
mmetsp:Transcript_8060/g.32568  ORF Transcript_8060/g.32568 Transcript_8060/m.32568 type:complete len:917 (-) Transcript_8060:61-2811(-)